VRRVKHNTYSLKHNDRSAQLHRLRAGVVDVLLCVTVEAEAQHVDDRCESDISGVATDDSDLSSMSSGADIAMETGSVVYRHQPNPFFNTMLTCCTVLVLCFAIGIGIGHYFGQSVATTAFTFLGLFQKKNLYPLPGGG